MATARATRPASVELRLLQAQANAAGCWDALTPVWRRADELFAAGILTAAQAEGIAGLCIQRSRALPAEG